MSQMQALIADSAILPARSRSPTLARPAAQAMLLALAALLIRLPHFGDPSFMIDEQFYLVAGDALLHGHLPFVDVWDRKPIGLFMIYAVAAAFGGWAVLAYQILATASAVATSWVIARIARPMAGNVAAIVAGLIYLLWIELAEGGGGQSPIFYNLPVATAGLLVLRAGDGRDERRSAFAAMALIGIAIQIKYTVVFEGLFFGLILAWQALTRLGAGAALRRTALLAATALAPTALVLAFYAAIGQAHTFIFTNFTSIFLRAPTDAFELHYRTEMFVLRLLPFIVCIAASLWEIRKQADAAAMRWRVIMIGWCAASLVGIFSIGTLYSHYILPAFVPFAIAAAPIFRRSVSGPVFAILLAWLPASTLHWPDFARTERHRAEIAALTALIPTDAKTGCLQMFDGPPILYWTTHACTLTRFIFPDHLSAANEEHAIGVDTVAELRRILALHPAAITISDDDVRPPNKPTFSVMRAALARDYVMAGKAPHDGRDIQVWVLRRLHAPPV